MPLESDLKFSHQKFDPAAVSDKTKTLNDGIIKTFNGGPKWYEVGAPVYRRMRWNGETPLPKPIVFENGRNTTLPSRDSGRTIPCRIFYPPDSAPKGILCHIHGGGWVLQSEQYQDNMLNYYAKHSGMVVVSVGYRLAPEDPYPKGNEDCFDVGEYLIDNGEKEFGAPLLFITGDSAGAHLSVLTTFHLLKSRPDFSFQGLVLNFGAFNLSGLLPGARNFSTPLVLDGSTMERYMDAYLPDTTDADRRDPRISPVYADMANMKLPPALFVIGTQDPLIDDNILMSTKWSLSGAESILKFYPGAPHGFTFFPIGGTEQTLSALEDIITFMTEKL